MDSIKRALFLSPYGSTAKHPRVSHYIPRRLMAFFMKNKCETKRWNTPLEEVAYFKSIVIRGELQGQGWGTRLSEKVIQMLRGTQNTAIVCHAWKESPNNSSIGYLEKLGFKPITEHKDFWSDLNYHCSKCQTPPCQCTALEMILYL